MANDDFTAKQFGSDGVFTTASNHWSITVDTTTPVKPVITGLADDAGAAIPAGGSTINAHPTVSGTAKAGDIVTLYDGSTVIGSAKVGADGKWSIKPSKDLSVGSHDVYAIDTNLAGAVSPQSAHVAFTVTSAFVPPVILNVADANTAHTGTVPAGGTTTDTHPTVSGTGIPGYTVNLYQNTLGCGATTVGADGKWSIKIPGDLSIGAHDFTATQFGVSGGESAASNHWSITVGTAVVAPTEVVTITGLYDDTSGSLVLVNKGGSTLDTTPIVKGTVDHALLSGESLAVYRDGTKVGTATMNGSNWSFADSGVGVGSHTYTARVENSAGNSAFSAGYGFTETSPFAPPVILNVADANTAHTGTVPAGGTTTDTHPTVSGTGIPGYTVNLYQNTLGCGATTVGADGKWSIKIPGDLSIGAHDFTATQFGVSGGESAASNHWSITVGTPAVAPTEVVTITGLYDDTSGSLVLVNKGGSTLDTTPIVKGTVDHALLSGESLAVYRDGTKVGTATMNGSSWSFNDSGVGVGSHTYTARVENSVGNSGFSAGYSFTESANITYPKIGVKGVLNSTLGIMIVCDGATSVTAPPSQFYIWQTNFGFHAWTGDYGQKYWVGETATGGNVAIQQGYYLPTDVFIFKGKDASGNAWTMTTTWGALWSINVLGQTNYLDGVKVTYSAMRDQSVSDAQEVTDLLHASVASNATVDQAVDVADHLRTVVGEHESFKGTTGHDTVDLNADPTSYFKESTAHIEGSTVHPVEAVGSVPAANTLHLTGDHQVLDLTSLTGKTAAAKISGIEAIDLGGHHNTLKLSLTDVLNLGETDLFMKDGKQQMMVQGKEGDEVDLSNSHIAGLAEGEWQAHGTAQVGGVTYNVYEHSGAHTELLVQQGVQIVVH